jgi:hypothetical protein
MIYAYSPQAKGRIERLWETLQDRLTLELQSCWYSISWGSKRLPSGIYLTVHARFAVIPREPQPAYRPLEEPINVDDIPCRKDARKIIQGSTFSFGGLSYH